MLWRQGDVFIESTTALPSGAAPQTHLVLADGELTGHQHRVEDPDAAVLFEHRGRMFLDVRAERAHIVHEEHGTIELRQGVYRVWRQREYDPTRTRATSMFERRLAGTGNSRYVFD